MRNTLLIAGFGLLVIGGGLTASAMSWTDGFGSWPGEGVAGGTFLAGSDDADQSDTPGYGLGPNSAEGAPEGSLHNLPLPEAVAAARVHLAERLDVEVNQVVILTAYERTWGNACLGMDEEGEMCAEVITPGYEVTMTAEGKTYAYHTNSDGSSLRWQDK